MHRRPLPHRTNPSNRAALSLALLLAGAAFASTARADIQTKGAELYPGKQEVSVHIGVQAGLGGYATAGGPPGGFKLMGDYNYRVWQQDKISIWLDAGLGLTLGAGCSIVGNGSSTPGYACGSFANGDTFDVLAGAKVKFKITQIPIVPYARANLVVNYIFDRYCGDAGVGIAPRVAGGAKYFLTKSIGLGLETAFTIGGALYRGASAQTGSACFNGGLGYFYPAHTELYATFEFLFGAEFAF